MKTSTKAALLSGLIFPGIGHLVLKHYVRATLLIVATLAAMSVIVDMAFQQAQSVVDQIYSGEIPLDSVAVAEAVANSTGGASGWIENAALLVLAACWLAGVVDSYRIGAARET